MPAHTLLISCIHKRCRCAREKVPIRIEKAVRLESETMLCVPKLLNRFVKTNMTPWRLTHTQTQADTQEVHAHWHTHTNTQAAAVHIMYRVQCI